MLNYTLSIFYNNNIFCLKSTNVEKWAQGKDIYRILVINETQSFVRQILNNTNKQISIIISPIYYPRMIWRTWLGLGGQRKNPLKK